MVRAVATVVPSPPISNARYREETRRHSSVLDIIWRPLLLEKSGRRVVLRIRNGLQRQICSVIPSEEAPPRSALWLPTVLSKNVYWNIDSTACPRDHVTLPFRRMGSYWDEAENQSNE